MFKLMVIFCLAVASVSAKPGIVAAPLVAAAPAVITAHSSQVVARSYNGFAAPLVAAPVLAHSAPLVAAHSAPLLAAHGVAAPLAYSSPLLSYSAYNPYAAAAHAVYV